MSPHLNSESQRGTNYNNFLSRKISGDFFPHFSKILIVVRTASTIVEAAMSRKRSTPDFLVNINYVQINRGLPQLYLT